MTDEAITLIDGAFGRTALKLTPMPFDEWLSLCRQLGAIAAGHQWWIGDALVYGEDRYGEDHAQGEAELGLASQTALNYRYVASRVEPARRRDDLTWSHHAEVARLAADAQERCLTIAAEKTWNVRQLRDYVAVTYPQSQARLFNDDEDGGLGERENRDVQKRIEEIDRRVESGELELDDAIGDLRWLLALVKRLTRGAR